MGNHLVSIHGLTAQGRHGANPGERDEPQEFVIDVEVEVDVTADTLDGTADYRALADTARKTVETTSFVLLESLAQAIAQSCSQQAGVRRVRATVHKPSAAGSMSVGDVAATATSEG